MQLDYLPNGSTIRGLEGPNQQSKIIITFINLALVPLGCSDLLVRQLPYSYSDHLSQPRNATQVCYAHKNFNSLRTPSMD